jgi:hypothetical protein
MIPDHIKIVLSFMISNIEKHGRAILEDNHVAIAKSVIPHSNVLQKRWGKQAVLSLMYTTTARSANDQT